MLKCYSVHDCKSVSFGVPFFCVSDGVATRMLYDAARDDNTVIAKHPEDFTLYCIGQFDEQKGLIVPLPIIDHICKVSDLVADRAREQLKLFPVETDRDILDKSPVGSPKSGPGRDDLSIASA